MTEIVTLLENYWICREQDRELYNRVKRDIPRFQKFAREQLGWKLLNHEKFLKLEKIPAHAESFMGIREFQDFRRLRRPRFPPAAFGISGPVYLLLQERLQPPLDLLHLIFIVVVHPPSHLLH